MRLDELLRAQSGVRVERPPELWEAQTDEASLVPLVGDMLAAGVSVGGLLSELVLNVSNVVFEIADDDPGPHTPPVGEYVAVTVCGPVDLGPDSVWDGSGSRGDGLLGRLHDRLVTAGARFAYVRRIPPEGSVTVWFPRA
jgi:hypothetical protein